MEPNYLPLRSCATGETVRVASLGTDTAFANRLRAMGIHDGAELEVVRTGTTMIVRIDHGSRLCLRGEDVAHVWVSPAHVPAVWPEAPFTAEGASAQH